MIASPLLAAEPTASTLFASREKLVFAHRGGAALAPENTLTAFANGLRLGSDGLECDVHLSRDGVPVVIHDATLERTTNGRGRVAARTAAELAALDAAFHFKPEDGHPLRGTGIGVPTLHEVLATHAKAPVVIELKQRDAALASAVIAVVRSLGTQERVCVGSFAPEGLQVVREEAPEIATSGAKNEVRWTLYRSWCRWALAAPRAYRAFQVPEWAGPRRVVSPGFVRTAHREGARVDVWVVDTAADVVRLFDYGVDGVITDRPDVAVRARDEWMRQHANTQTAGDHR